MGSTDSPQPEKTAAESGSENNTEAKTKAFYDEINHSVTGGFLTISLAIGSRLGLVQVLAEFSEPATSEQIANKAGLRERYVREWLGSMVGFNVVDVSEDGTLYFLPEYRRKVLTPIGMDLATLSWCVPLMAGVSDDLMQCFKNDGPPGLPYSKYGIYHEWRDERTKGIQSWGFIEGILKKTPGLLAQLESGGVEVCDLGCGTGRSTMMMAEHYPKSHFYGLDISEEAIARGRELANEKGLKNVTFLVQDICKMPDDWTDRWDYIVAFDVIHDVPHTTQAMAETYRTLKPGAWFSLVDINLHTNPALNANSRDAGMMYTVSLFHCMPVSLNGEGGEGLGAAWGKEKAVKMLKETGYKNCYFASENGLIYHCLANKVAN